MSSRGAIYWAGFALVARQHLGLKSFSTTLLASLLAADGHVVDGDKVRSIWGHHGPVLTAGTIRVGACLLREALVDVGFDDPIQTWSAGSCGLVTGYAIAPTMAARIIDWMEARV